MGTRGCGLVITGNYHDWPTKNWIVLGELTFRSWEWKGWGHESEVFVGHVKIVFLIPCSKLTK